MKRRRLIRQGEKIPIKLGLRERDLICESTFRYPKLTERLKISLLDEDKIIAKYSLEELNILLEFIAAEATHTDDKSLQAELTSLGDRLIDISKSFIEE
ncbi:MAG TPA: hypothetical protein PKM41_13450 [Deltaproteobacteria bacterium]|jgi:hypothetical protein|nr:hypothetical protein [Deltaproteobacteria bacterium]HOI07552.1 hypothetical protein [Deltaproteobacteria bacterium]